MLLDGGPTGTDEATARPGQGREADALHVARVHGHRLTYRQAGEGRNVVVLVHGLADSSRSWRRTAAALAAAGDATVLVPDLLGTPGSDAPRAFDYTLGAHAAILRDFLVARGHDRVTIVGHSLGGGIALAFAWQFPAFVERLVLVASGGLGREVGLPVRALTLPGAGTGLALATAAPVRATVRAAARLAPALRLVAQRLDDLASADARQATLVLMRSLLDRGGQRTCGLDRFGLLADIPLLVVWGGRDRIIPVGHAEAARLAAPHAELTVFPGAGHLLQLEDPGRLAGRIAVFLAATPPATVRDGAWGPAIRGAATA